MKPDSTLTLLVPGIDLGSPMHIRGDRASVPATGVPQTLAWLAGHDRPLPFAALSALAAGHAAGTGPWMRIDPVHLVADPDGLKLLPASMLDIEEDEARSLTVYLSVNGDLAVEMVGTRFWIAPAASDSITLHPIHDVIGRNIAEYLPEGEARMKYRKWMNELQMVMHDAPVNRRRLDAGHLTINSIWPWGRGELDVPLAWPFDLSAASDPAIAGVAEVSGTQAMDVPATLQALPKVGRVFVWVESGGEEWAKAAYASLAAGDLDEVRILDGEGGMVTMRPAMRWRFWRRG